jgi:PQQ-like domain
MGRVRAGVVAVLLTVAMSGCWLQPGFGSEHTHANLQENGLTTANVGSLHQVWSVDLAGSSASEPLIARGRAFLTASTTSSGSSVRAFSLSSGAALWQHPVPEPCVNRAGSITFSGDDLWFGHFDPTASPCPVRLTALDPDTGDVVTDSESVGFPVSSPVTSGAVAAHTESTGCATLGDIPSTLIVQDTTTHTTQWTATLPHPAGGPTISGGVIYVNVGDQLYAYAADGCGAATCDPLWVREIPGVRVVADGRIYTVNHRTVVIDPIHGVTAQEALLTVYAADTGDALWGRTYIGEDPFQNLGAGAISSIAVAGDLVYVGASQDTASPPGAVSMVDAFPTTGCGTSSCAPTWTGTVPGAPSSVVVGGDVVYVAAGNPTGSVIAFDRGGCGSSTCAPLATVAVPGAPTGMSVAQGTLLVTSSSTLTALRASSS